MSGLYSIGELARRTGLTVKTIRSWSDRGLLPPAARTHAGHRRYDAQGLARLELVSTLRELGIGLATVRRILDRQVALADVARAHADALAVQIQSLQRRHAVLAAMAGGPSTKEMTTMYESEQEAIRDFLDRVFGGFADQAFDGIRRSWTPVLPDDPDDAQQQAYAELAGLTRDPEFRATMRRSAEMFAEDRARSGEVTAHPDAVTLARQRRALTSKAAAKTTQPTAAVVHRPGLAEQIAAADDPRRHRYESLLATINGWGPDPTRSPGQAAA